MSDRIKEFREKRTKLVTDMKALTDKVQLEKRAMTAEELKQHDTMFNEQDNLRQNIEAEERNANIARQQAEHDARRQEELERQEREGRRNPSADQRSAMARLGLEYRAGWDAEKMGKAMKAFRTYLSGDQMAAMNARNELRTSLQASDDVEGGYLVAPMEFVARLIIFVNNIVFIRSKATVLRVNTGASLGAPSLDADVDDADWTTELNTGNEDTGIKFGRRELSPHPLAKRVKISKRLLRISAMPSDEIVMQRLAYKFGVTEEKGFMLGTGQQQPLGVFVASNDGIPTSRDVSTGNTTTAMTFDGLKETKYSVKAQYQRTGEWIFHRDGIKMLSKLKDGDGQYLWQTSVQDGEPDRLLSRPVNMSEYAPNTFTTGQYVGIFGDFSNYWIADALDMQIQRLIELYAESNQDGFIARKETDGMPVLAEAFARVKLA